MATTDEGVTESRRRGGNWHEVKVAPLGFVICGLLGGYFLYGATSALPIHAASANNFRTIALLLFLAAGVFYVGWVLLIYADAKYVKQFSTWDGTPEVYLLTLLVPILGLYYMEARWTINRNSR